MPAATVHPVDVRARGVVERLERAATAADGAPSLGAAVWRDLDAPGPDSAAFVVEHADGDAVAYARVARSDTFAAAHWTVSLVVDPHHRDDVTVLALLDAAVDHVARHGGGRLEHWVFRAGADDDERLARAGFAPARELSELRVALPLAEEARWPPGVTVRTFEPGRDEAAWLEVNNLAFGNHPDQGAWVEATLRRRMAEPWFDPSAFLLAFDDHGLAGFDWCKVHPADGAEPARGEIFVIGVHPRAQGTGLGRALAVAGLGLLADRGLRTGSLFVDGDNTAALALYRSLGFSVHRHDRAYEREVPAR